MLGNPAPAIPDSLLSTLAEEADAALLQGGRAVFVIGPQQSANAACIDALTARVRGKYKGTPVLSASCAREAGNLWANIDRRISGRRRRLGTAMRILAHWVGVIPIVGPLLGAIADSIIALKRRSRLPTLLTTARPATEAVRSTLAHVRDVAQVIFIDDLQAAAPEDLTGLNIFLRSIRETRTLLVVCICATPEQLPQYLRDLVLEAEYNARARVLTTGAADLAGSLLELDEPDRELLAMAAVEGPVFHAIVLAHVLQRPELEIEDELARLARQGVLQVCALPGTQAELTTRYTFRYPKLAEALTSSLAEDVRLSAAAAVREAQIIIPIFVDPEGTDDVNRQ